VERNRLKRRLRELVRCEILPLLPELRADLVIRTGPRAYAAEFDVLRTELKAGVDQAVTRIGSA
jgi:ribonuclease P protein component